MNLFLQRPFFLPKVINLNVRQTINTVHIFQKLWYQHVWPSLQQEMRTQEVLAAVLQPVLYLIQDSTVDDYESIILPSFR